MTQILDTIADKLYDGKHREIAALAQQALDEGLTAKHILDDGLIAGMNRVGQDFRDGVRYIPEVMLSAKTMNAALDVLRPLLAESGTPVAGKVVIGTVKGDIHDVGKKLVGIMLTGAGFQLIDLGCDVSPERFVEAIQNEKPDLVGMSALLTTTMTQMKATLQAMVAAGVRDKVKVLVGGAPVTEAYAEEIEADAYAPDAASAVRKARFLIGLAV
ncbi:MAG: corrinoid protein [Chloroflexi bacterium]|nr:corrinoid protein [Chloroflexota bacterium]